MDSRLDYTVWEAALESKKEGFSFWIIILMIGAVLILVFSLWTGFAYVYHREAGDLSRVILSQVVTILLVVAFLIGMVFTLRRKLWGFWVFAITSPLMFVLGGLPGPYGTLNQIGVVGFLGTAAALLIYRRRDLLS